MKRLAIIGSGDLGQLIAYHAQTDKQYEVVGFFDDFALPDTFVGNHKVLGPIDAIKDQFNAQAFECLMIGIGYNHMDFRRSIFEKHRDIPFANLIHSSSFIDPSVQLGTGIFILPGCTVDTGVILKDNVLLNTACTIAHDSEIGEHSFLSPRVSIAGKTHVGNSCILGINCTIIDHLRIAPEIRIGAGAVVVNNLLEKGTYLGIPAKLKS